MRALKLEPSSSTTPLSRSPSPSPSPTYKGKRGRDEEEDEYKPAVEWSPERDEQIVEDGMSDDHAPARRRAKKIKNSAARNKNKNKNKASKSPKNAGSGRTPGPVKRWSADDNEALLLAAIGSVSVKNFEGTVPGRNPKQCYDQWGKTLLPHLRNKAREKGV